MMIHTGDVSQTVIGCDHERLLAKVESDWNPDLMVHCSLCCPLPEALCITNVLGPRKLRGGCSVS